MSATGSGLSGRTAKVVLCVLLAVVNGGCVATPGRRFNWYPVTEQVGTEQGVECYFGIGRQF